ncbi:MAG: hypothetical protein GX548_11490 [Lentisphaerae bacterium]|nr:hypothetical protein [Lentisphaerota bacterium]
MKKLHCLPYAFALLLIVATVVPSVAFEPSQTADMALNVIATNAFRILRDVPSVGLEKSMSGLEQIIEAHRRLSRETDIAQQQLSLVLADAVAYAIVTEVHRAEVARLGTDQGLTPKSIPFDKKTAMRLWKANMHDFPAAIRKALQGQDAVTSFVSRQSSEEDVLSGAMIDKAPLETIRPRIRSLQEKVLHTPCFSKSPSADEQLVYALSKHQAFRDPGIVMELYEKGDLPGDASQFRAAIDGVLKQHPGKRVDDGMNASSFKTWMTFRRYHPEGTSQDPVAPIEEYYLKQALALAPFMTDTCSLPETAKKALTKIDGPAPLP